MTQAEALDILKTGANVFLTGEPGAGKTHTVNTFVRYLREHEITVAITASTGIAATHIGGMTIHSWAGIGIKRYLDKYSLDRIASNERVVKRVTRARMLIIDEVSMLGPGTLDMVDAVCRAVRRSQESFGGLSVLLVGDFFQLPPVVRRQEKENVNGDIKLIEDAQQRFAYESGAWQRTKFLTCYLSGQYRQDDKVFLEILSAIRRNEFGEEHMRHIAKRKLESGKTIGNISILYSHNVDVDRVNTNKLSRIDSET